ncbi:hypothetical protein N0V90_005956 [Kalmusia sp. IMI 367209]|nr:hypothetical protein N0V90_005956 [Kalmusia sp. IMI 367209]
MSAVPALPENTPLIANDGITNGTTNGTAAPFKLHDEFIENLRPLKVIVIGAGYSAHSYQYTFEPNHDWSSLYAPAREIQAYLERVAKKYSADRFIKLSHEVVECRWDDAVAKWNVTVKSLTTGELIHDQSDVLISARGNLNNPSWPDIEGLNTFKGEVMHSAKWNEEYGTIMTVFYVDYQLTCTRYDFTNKRIGVIGAGSSSIQIVPSLQRISGTHVTTFVRSKTWISPSFGQQLWDKYGFEGFSIPPELRKRFVDDPEYYAKFRLAVEEDGNGIHAVTIRGTPLQLGAKQMFEEHMKTRLEKAPHIFDTLLPSFSPGCRRLTPGPGYLEALTQPNVAFVTSRITKISDNAIHTADGATHEIDALVCATGFHANTFPPFPVTGSNGLTLREKWASRPVNYLSHSIAGFPNMFCMLGANSAIGSGSLTTMIENVGDYVIKAIRKLQKEDIACMVAKREREEDFSEYVDAYFKGTVFSEECNSWYKSKTDGAVVGLWPGSALHCIEAMRSPRWEDFEYIYRDELGTQDGQEDESGSEGVVDGEREDGARKRLRIDSMAVVDARVGVKGGRGGRRGRIA